MVEDAVFSELASENSHLNGNLMGNFSVLAQLRSPRVVTGELFEGLTGKFPLKWNWEISEEKWESDPRSWEMNA